MTITLITVGLVFAVALVAVAAARFWWQHATSTLVERLRRLGASVAARSVDFSLLTSLPPPVARYLRLALENRRSYVARARLSERGRFRTALHGPWHAMTAVEDFTTTPPGFVWNGSIRMAPAVDLDVCDAYVGGASTMRAAVLGAVPIGSYHDTPELNEGELVRYLSECVWMPTRFLPGNGVTWRELTDTSAIASITDRDTTASLEFHFSPTGDVVSAVTTRGREDAGRFIPTPWIVQYGHAEEHGGMRVPAGGSACWMIDGKKEPYASLRLESAEYVPVV